jgi:dTMP kinase
MCPTTTGTGKSTTIEHLVPMLVAAGHDVHLTCEPSTGPIGVLARQLTGIVHGRALAYLWLNAGVRRPR